VKGQRLPSKTKGFSIKTKTKGFRLPSKKEQLRLLKKKGINIGRARTTWSVYRLYNYYITQRHPKSSPRYLAYGTGKQFERRIETAKEPEKILVRTGTGKKVSAASVIRRLDKESQKEFERELPSNVTFTYGKRYTANDKIRDPGIYQILPPIKASVLTIEQARKRAQLVTDDIINIIHIAQRTRKRFYVNYDIGGNIIAEGRNFNISGGPKNPPIIVTFPTTGLYRDDHYFQRALMDQGFEDVFKALYAVSAQDKAVIIIYRVELKIITDRRPSNISRLRSR
jgi:hypothetical protein